MERLKRKKQGIHIKPSHEGLLRSETHTKSDNKIPVKKLEEEKHSKSPAMRKRAVFALNARKWKH